MYSTQMPYFQSIDAMSDANIPALQRTGRQRPRPLNGAGTSSPQRQEVLPYLCDWGHGAKGGKHEKTATAKKIAAESQQDEKQGKDREKCRWAWPLERHGAVQIA